MRIVNPAFGRETVMPDAASAVRATPFRNAPIDWRSDPIVLFSNSKANAPELLRGMSDRLQGPLGRGPLDLVSKSNSGLAAPIEIIEQVARDYRGAIVATGD